jgi:FkbM family methyltransferase
MSLSITDGVKKTLDFFGLFAARQFPGRVTGHDLGRDLRLIVPGDAPVCFDVGANQGQTIRLFQRHFPAPVIHAFEPAAATYETLAGQSFGAQVHLHQLALGDQNRVAEFRNYKQTELSSFLAMNPDKTENLFADQEVLSVESVQVATLDGFCTERAVDHIDLLKIDTQGFELPVLQGGADLFARKQVGAVLLELNFAALYEQQSDPLAVLGWLRTHQLRLVDFYEKERITGKELSWTTALFVR